MELKQKINNIEQDIRNIRGLVVVNVGGVIFNVLWTYAVIQHIPEIFYGGLAFLGIAVILGFIVSRKPQPRVTQPQYQQQMYAPPQPPPQYQQPMPPIQQYQEYQPRPMPASVIPEPIPPKPKKAKKKAKPQPAPQPVPPVQQQEEVEYDENGNPEYY